MASDTDEQPNITALRIFRRESPVRVLGPYARAVVWVQGCHFQCHGCIVPESWDAEGGETATLNELTEWVLAQPDIEGITISGGEPMNQAAAVGALIDRVRARRDLGVMCYTGFSLDFLRQRGSAPQQALLERLDILIDGVYIASRHGDLLWRGSSNQTINLLSERYRQVFDELNATRGDRSAGVEATIDESGAFALSGVPSMPGFREEFLRRLGERGIRFAPKEQEEVTQ